LRHVDEQYYLTGSSQIMNPAAASSIWFEFRGSRDAHPLEDARHWGRICFGREAGIFARAGR
jgi:hypothetical protein